MNALCNGNFSDIQKYQNTTILSNQAAKLFTE